jgi:glycosyltransferase involved in cell wall biosynthesis
LHTFTGQVWATKKGIRRWILKSLDKLIIILNSKILVDSSSQKAFMIDENLLNEENASVLGNGSLGGIDLQRFKPSKKEREAVRKKLNIPSNCVVFLFVGRIKKDKGVFELVRAFKNISKKNSNSMLLIVGPDEDNLINDLNKILDFSVKYTRFIDFTKAPEIYMMASDIFVIPSYREGFGNVVVEAASCGIPSIGSDIYGLSDSIKDGETGILIPVKSEKDLERAMIKLLDNEILRIKMGESACYHAKKYFSQDILTLQLIQFYQRIILQ